MIELNFKNKGVNSEENLSLIFRRFSKKAEEKRGETDSCGLKIEKEINIRKLGNV